MLVGPFNIQQASGLSGVGREMIRYLVRTGICVPKGSRKRGRGRALQFTYSDVVMLRAISKLLARGIQPSRLREGLKSLRKRMPQTPVDTIATRFLATDGKYSKLVVEQEIIEDLRTGQFEFSFILDLHPIQAEILEEYEKSPERFKKASRRP